jgi:hypothetical protein
MTKLDPTTLISHIFLLLICINYAKSIVAPATDDNGYLLLLLIEFPPNNLEKRPFRRFKVFQIKASSIDQVKELFRMEQQGIV